LRAAVVAVVVVLAAAGAYVEQANPGGISFSPPFGAGLHQATGPQDSNAATSTQAVTRRSLSETTPVPGALGYAGSYGPAGWPPPSSSAQAPTPL
jgi:hypothetical protein